LELDTENDNRNFVGYAAVAMYGSLKDSAQYVALVCTTLGDLNEHKSKRQFNDD
jgi:hypothetical protein